MDGREPSEYRPLEIETNILSHANGSASIRIVSTSYPHWISSFIG